MLGRRMQAREHPVQTFRQLEAALHREWQQLSQQDIRRLTGGMRRRVEAVIISIASFGYIHKEKKLSTPMLLLNDK
jgi:cobalamin biosynthesis protein CobD/CbiB